MKHLIDFLENHMLTCFYKKYSGVDCPGCGMQRAFIELLKGNFLSSLTLYPALLPLCFTFGLLFTHLLFNLKHGATYLKISFLVSSTIILIAYLYKMFLLFM